MKKTTTTNAIREPCSRAHVLALAAYRNREMDIPLRLAAEEAGILLRASYAARIPLPGGDRYTLTADGVFAVRPEEVRLSKPMTNLAALKLCASYRQQIATAPDMFPGPEARTITDALLFHALCHIPGWSSAPWTI